MSRPTAARRVAYEVLRRTFEHGAWADRALRSAAERAGLAGRERAQAQRLAFGAVQRRGTSDFVVERLAGRAVERIDAPLLAALRLGLFELLFEDASTEHAAVDQAVGLAKGGEGRRRGAGLVNAVLRRAAREREEILAGLDDSTPEGAAVAHSLPPWIAELWWREQGPERARALMRAANVPPRRVYRANRIAGDPAEILAGLRERGVDAAAPAEGPLGAAEMVAVEGGDWEAVEEAVSAGRLVPQSLGSAAVVRLLAAAEGERVLDLCAAPGIKTTQIAAAVGLGGEVVAVERDRGRAAALRELCERAGARNVRVIEGDATTAELGEGYDRVLVDAPCSGLGTLASRPDARWRRDAEGIEQTAALQRRLLERGLAAARPGAPVLYSVCTISRREGAGVAEAGIDGGDAAGDELGAELPELADADDRRFLQILPDRDGTDGFFIARLRRPA